MTEYRHTQTSKDAIFSCILNLDVLGRNVYYVIYSEWSFSGLLTDGGQKASHLPKICHKYPAMMKLGTVTPYLKKIQKINKSHDTLLKFC